MVVWLDVWGWMCGVGDVAVDVESDVSGYVESHVAGCLESGVWSVT